MELPHVIEAHEGEELLGRIGRDRTEIRRRLRTEGAVLLRGFTVGGVDGFESAVRALSGEDPLPYEERSSPRSTIKGRVYTSTEYPPHEEIFFHNENSYRTSWPMSLYFYCVEPPADRGATPLADTRQVLRTLDPAVREEFERRGWMVVRNFGSEFGLSWQEVFGTEDRALVERLCAAGDVAVEWRADGRLRTTSLRRAVHRHPQTGDEVWFNHAAVFHLSTLSPENREGMLELFGEKELPNQSYFGDGADIPDDVMAHVRDCYRSAATRFDYARDDVLVVDNMLTAHGREPFTRPRTIAVAMAEAVAANGRG
ncbi:TauD/TfdA family dioxygenase [Streptomyces sp. NPDC050658]|uniref:TauD/TfdA family dioxygenase n=1 Tax=unclassified Streptomyces TaxID=2593676 RepID=UPI00341C08FB